MAARTRCPHRLLHLGVTLLVVGMLCLTAHASVSAHPATQPLPTLRLNYYTFGPGWKLDPALVTQTGPAVTISLVQANLVRLLPDGRPVPDLATWTVDKKHLVYTFTIRKNARFANGHPVTAEDAAFSIRRALAPATNSPVADFFLTLIQGADDYFHGKTHSIPGLKVLSRRVLRITITKPVAYFLVELAYPTAEVLDPSVVAGKPVGVRDPKTGIVKGNYLTTTCTGNQGAGPFQFVCRDRSSNPHSFYAGSSPRYTLVPNPYYYGPKPHIQIELPQYRGGRAGDYKLYLVDKLDTAGIPSVFVSRWRNRSKEYHAYPDSQVWFLEPNVHLPPFDNLHCRLAVAYAIDRASLAADISHGTSRASYTVVPKGMLGFYDGKDNPHYSLSRMRAELARCPGRTVPIEYKYWVDYRGTVGEAVGNELIAAGMNVRPVPLSTNDWIQVVGHPLDQTKTQIVWIGWQQDYPDPQDYCTLLRSGDPFNVGGWHSAAYDRLVDRADFVLDPQKRAQLYIQAQHIALSQGAWISLTNELAPVLIKPYVHGLVGSGNVQITARNNDWANVSISKH